LISESLHCYQSCFVISIILLGSDALSIVSSFLVVKFLSLISPSL
ncbi:4918_t:CDS:1, partial [Racocetra persica]